jgi:hypothetical protein
MQGEETMKTLFVAALLCGVALPAHAQIICGSPYQSIGKVGSNPGHFNRRLA